MGRVRAVTDAGLDDALLEAPGAVVLSFWASWCAPCLTMAPVVTELAERFGDRLAFVSVDVDAEPNVPARYGVEEVPSYVVVHAGEPVATIVGARPKPTLRAELEPFAAPGTDVLTSRAGA